MDTQKTETLDEAFQAIAAEHGQNNAVAAKMIARSRAFIGVSMRISGGPGPALQLFPYGVEYIGATMRDLNALGIITMSPEALLEVAERISNAGKAELLAEAAQQEGN